MPVEDPVARLTDSAGGRQIERGDCRAAVRLDQDGREPRRVDLPCTDLENIDSVNRRVQAALAYLNGCPLVQEGLTSVLVAIKLGSRY